MQSDPAAMSDAELIDLAERMGSPVISALAQRLARQATEYTNAGKLWSKCRSMLSDFGERYRSAARSEEASAIADDVSRKITDMFLSARQSPTAEGWATYAGQLYAELERLMDRDDEWEGDWLNGDDMRNALARALANVPPLSSAPASPTAWTPPLDGSDCLASTTGKVWFQAAYDDRDGGRWWTFNLLFEDDRRRHGEDEVFRPKFFAPLPTIEGEA